MKKFFYLIRHAKAMNRVQFKKPDDSLRPLLPEGIQKFEATLKQLKKKKTKIKHCYHSPFLRCAQTAALLEKSFKIKSHPMPHLAHGEEVSKLILQFFEIPSHSALIGHEPELSELCLLLGIKATLFKKGEVRKICLTVQTQKLKI